MDNGIFSLMYEFCSLLLIIVTFLLNILFSAFGALIYIIKVILQYIIHLNMSEKTSKRKKNTPRPPNQTLNRVIDENWQKLLSSNLMDVKTEQKPDDNKNIYTGVFRRGRKKCPDYFEVKNSEHQNKDEQNPNKSQKNSKKPVNQLTKFIAIDCEMVGVGYGGCDHMLARVSLVNKFGDCIYDKFVKPREEVVDYRTKISGIREENLLVGEEFLVVQKEVAEILKGKILVGHSLKNDLKVLYLSHPKCNIRDTARYKPFRKIKDCTPSLKTLTKDILGINIQDGEHSSVEDAKAVMQVYCAVSKSWEQALSEKRGYSRKFVET